MLRAGEVSCVVASLPPAGRLCVFVLLLISASSSSSSSSSSVNVCRTSCICSSDIISCSQRNLSSPPAPLPHFTSQLDLSFNSITRLRSDWTPVRLSSLNTLLLSHNGLLFLFPEAFVQVRRLRHLDLSSNSLTHLDEFIFEPLPHLEVLILYDNQISLIDRMFFSGLLSLQKLYLSHNRVTRFPLELLKDRSRLDKLRLLDVSSNRIKALPLAELQVLPAWLKEHLYFHGNPLDCSCELFTALSFWQKRKLHPVSNFPESHECLWHRSSVGGAKITINILQLHLQLNCSTVQVQDQEAFLNQILILDCDSRYRDVIKNWTAPPQADHSTVQVLEDGRLQVGPLQVENSGQYRCDVEGEGVNETLVVTVKVFNSTQSFGDGLNTAYTTLSCCVLTVVLVLIYLYLTPCPCSQDLDLNTDTIHTSNLNITLTPGHQGAPHLPLCELREQNDRIKDEGEEEEKDEERRCEEEEKERRQSSVTSDTPIMTQDHEDQ